MKKYLILAAITMLGAVCCAPKSLQDKLTVNDKKINEIIAQMTLEEKVEMLHSKTNMSSEGVPRLGIQDIKYTDGPFGIREENGDGFRPLGWKLDSATYFPTGSALAATWSPELEAFQRVTLKAGKTKTVTLTFPVEELAHWDMEVNDWVIEKGKYEILVGSASDDIRQSIMSEI